MAEAICVSAFLFELHRALGGNTLSWAYVFEWPILAAYGVYMWRKLVEQERGAPAFPPPAAVRPDDEQALREMNEYLARVHRDDTPRPPQPSP